MSRRNISGITEFFGVRECRVCLEPATVTAKPANIEIPEWHHFCKRCFEEVKEYYIYVKGNLEDED